MSKNKLELPKKTYFIIYETRHNGWQGEMINASKVKEYTEDEDNMEVFVCFTYNSIVWKDLIDVDILNQDCLIAWKENFVTCVVINNEMEVNCLKSH